MSLNPLFEIAPAWRPPRQGYTHKDLLKPCNSCRLCGMFREEVQNFETTCGLPDDWAKTRDDLPDDCWRPVGTVLIWDSERVCGSCSRDVDGARFTKTLETSSSN